MNTKFNKNPINYALVKAKIDRWQDATMVIIPAMVMSLMAFFIYSLTLILAPSENRIFFLPQS